MASANLESNSTVSEPKSQPVLLLRKSKSKSRKYIKRFALEKFRLSIGRSPDNDIRLAQANGVSRNHAIVFVLDGEIVIEDLGSRNGTYVNKKLIRGNRQTTLKFGDVITIGRYRLKLVDEAVSEQADAAPDIQTLLHMWQPAAVVSLAKKCGLCHSPDAAMRESRADEIEEQQTTESETLDTDLDDKTRATSETPNHGRLFERNLPRRPRLGKQRKSSRRNVLNPVNRSSRSRGSTSVSTS